MATDGHAGLQQLKRLILNDLDIVLFLYAVLASMLCVVRTA